LALRDKKVKGCGQWPHPFGNFFSDFCSYLYSSSLGKIAYKGRPLKMGGLWALSLDKKWEGICYPEELEPLIS
jgi:hypothetical protein